ncbi:isoleucine--tRNA ligase [Porphyrobacter sp. YT40]|uniref:isoleucine--tRNA ligase n=1 Tax=Porphyrobacter sp. YT40 TaxID=2547601 RepID=UPI001143DCB1|nr:isoleucine--tRNA ligase [Porphyrobacter sp. YT40]QDH33510.1 isoleucine--tRNA ligase [Porphyrobacter sp. YT40]
MSEDTPARDYRDTVFLPKTDFPMKAGLPQKEPGIAARWEQIGLYDALRKARRGREKFILHDGPPYANGDMHIGHALNHILKDMVCRTQNLLGRDAPYVPGWDCHGLPIEWKVEEQYRKEKKAKPVLTGAGRDEAAVMAFRNECRAYAQKWVDTQRAQLKRLGIMGDWDHPYLTMQKESEAVIVAELLKLAEAGNLYRGSKPVMWSPVEQTALAEAEVEYEDITSTQIDVAFEIVESPIPELVGAHAVIWTTTPWTIPVNQALAYGPEVEYRLIEIESLVHVAWRSVDEPHPPYPEALRAELAGRKYLIASALVEEFKGRFEAELARNGNSGVGLVLRDRWNGKGADLAGTLARHPMHELGGFYATPRPLLPGDFVTTDSGTGLVHMAPDHGEDDFELCKSNGINPVFAVMDDGRYRDDWGWLGAADVDSEGNGRRMSVINPKFNAPDGPICSDLREAGALLAASADYAHSYPHSWRSKAKVIFRCTPQWFVPMDKPLDVVPAEAGTAIDEGAASQTIPAFAGMTLRERAVSEIARVQFIPEKGRNRIGAMVEGRPDWVLSRQRAWGVPITLFVRPDGSYLQDAEVNARIVAAVNAKGMDAWNSANKAAFLGPDHDPADYAMVTDILDVWFDSGCTHAFVLESGRWPDLQWPANLYLEGSDQHRGWFQSSLLESCVTRGRAPYDQVLTHGFTMDAKGKKMSKSLGNTVDPLKVMETYGADIIRLWALSVDFTEDHRIGDEILKGVGDQYRKLRNTFRYLLGALDGFVGDMSDAGELPELEVYILSLLSELDGKLKAAALAYDFNLYTRLLVDFCNEDLSAFFFDIRKDALYCDGPDSTTRNAYRTVLDLLFHALVRYAAPVLVFTAEEVWLSRYPEDGEEDDDGQRGSVHLLEWPSVPKIENDELVRKWSHIRELRDEINEAIEPLRRDKTIRSSLEAEVIVRTKDALLVDRANSVDMAEIAIAASVQVNGFTDDAVPEVTQVTVTKTNHHKCGRCWRLLPDVAEDGALCGRCEEVVGA